MSNVDKPMTATSRNYSFDILKFFLAFLIVLHHSPSPYHDFLQPVTTCAVPCFFMVSGYLIFNREITATRVLKNGIRILKIFGWSLLLFYFWYYIRHNDFYIPTIKDICLFVFANNEPVSGHLWYLTAYAYTLFLIAFLAKYHKIHWFRTIAITGLLFYFLFDAWHIYYDVPKYLTLVYCFRNFYFTAIPMVYIGAAIAEHKYHSIKTTTIFLLLGLFGILALLEMNWLKFNHIADVYFATIPLAVTIFLFFTKVKVQSPNILSICGEKYSLYIYIIHPIIIKLLVSHLDGLYLGVVAFILTLIVSMIYVYIKNLIIENFKKTKI